MPIITQREPLPPAAALRQPDKTETLVAAVAAAPEVSKDAATPADPQQKNFAVLARKEKALRRQFQELKAEKEALKAKESEYEANYIPKTKLAERLKSDPLAVAMENGLSIDDLTNAILNSRPEDINVRKLQQKVEQLETQQSQVQTRIEEDQKKAYEQAVHQIRTETKLLIDSDPAFETIKEMDSSEAVVELIKQTFDQKGVLLSPQEAAIEVEEYLLEKALRMAELKKVKEKLTPSEVQQQLKQTPKTSMPAKTAPLSTLTNQASASSKPLTNKERRERAIAAFYGQTII